VISQCHDTTSTYLGFLGWQDTDHFISVVPTNFARQ
jgi:hypothetical protein